MCLSFILLARMAVVKVCDNLDLALEHVRTYEEDTKSVFVSYMTLKKAFGSTEFDLSNDRHKVQWLSDYGIPYFHINRIILDCKHGPDRHVSTKAKLKQKKQQSQDHTEIGKFGKTIQDTIKLDCPAQITLIEAITFPNYRVTNLTNKRKVTTSIHLRRVLREKGGSFVKSERKIIVILPAEDAHKNHPIGDAAGNHQLVASKIKKKIQSLVADSSFTSVRHIKESLEDFVRCELFPEPSELPKRTNRRFYPCERDIKNIAHATLRKLSLSKSEQRKTLNMVKKHAAEHPFDYIFFRPATRIDDVDAKDDAQGNKMLFVFQSQEQKQLMNRYGNYVCLLDATYRTMKYSLPLFFICVKTYVDYHVVAMFVLQDEKTLSIMEALRMIKEENPGWQPKDFLTDFCEQEIAAVEQIFDDSFVFICDFHREQAWARWVSKLSHGVPANRRNEALALLRKVADSDSERELEDCLNSLGSSDLWQTNPMFQAWFTREWLQERTCKRWVWAYRKDKLEINVYTNNGIERQNECLKYKYLCNKKQQSLCSMIHIVITRFFPDRYMRYCELNFRVCSEYRRYSSNVPSYLIDRPKSFVFHCIQQLSIAEDIDPNHIQKISPIIFSVQSQSNSDKRYIVSLGNQDDMPCCECHDWVKSKWLCKHFFAIFLNSDVNWNDLSRQYRESPYLNLDVTVPGIYVQNKSEEPVNIGSNIGPLDHTTQEQPQFLEVGMPSESEDKLSNSDLIGQCRDHLVDIQSRISNFINRNTLEELERDLSWISARLRRQMAEEDGLCVSSGPASITIGRNLPLSQKRKKENNNEADSPECGALSMKIPDEYTELPQAKKKQIALRHHLPLTHNNATSTSCIDSTNDNTVIEDGVVSSFNLLVPEDNKNPVTLIASTADDNAVIQEGVVSSFILLVPDDNDENPVTMITSTTDDNAVIEDGIVSSFNLLVPEDNQNPFTVIASSADDSSVIEDGIVPSFNLLVPEDNKNPATVIASAADDSAVIEEGVISSFNLLVPEDNKNPVTVISSNSLSIRHLEIKQLQRNVKKGLPTENEIENEDLMELTSSDDEENDNNNSPLGKVRQWKKVGPYQLLESDRDIVLNENAWLNDSLINAAQYILSQKFPTVSGLQDTQLSKTLGFHPPEIAKRLIQVLNVNGNHWVAISTSFRSSTVKIYDSLSANKTHSSISFQEDVASILMTTEPTVSLITENVCQQSKTSQCGVYAIAFAVALCQFIDPCTMVLHEDLLRQYLLHMLETDQPGQLPYTQRDLSLIKPIKKSSFRVYCHCRLPWNHNNGIDMVECMICKNWYHVDVCENVPANALQNKNMVCRICDHKELT